MMIIQKIVLSYDTPDFISANACCACVGISSGGGNDDDSDYESLETAQITDDGSCCTDPLAFNYVQMLDLFQNG